MLCVDAPGQYQIFGFVYDDYEYLDAFCPARWASNGSIGDNDDSNSLDLIEPWVEPKEQKYQDIYFSIVGDVLLCSDKKLATYKIRAEVID